MDRISSFPLWSAALATVALYTVYGVIYRIFLSPVAKFPGPKLAALTYWVEFYHDVIRRGRYTWEIEKMHEKYGPIIRISPTELHIRDVEFYSSIYVSYGTRRTEKVAYSYAGFGLPSAGFATVDHNLHRMRRNALNPSFSKKSVAQLQPLIQAHIDKFGSRVEEYRVQGKPINLTYAHTALSSDILSDFCFANSFDALSIEDFNPSWHHMILSTGEGTMFLKNIPWLLPLFMNLPRSIIALINPPALPLIDYKDAMTEQILRLKERLAVSNLKEDHKTVYHELLANSALPPSELTMPRLVQEGVAIIGAGTMTTSQTLTLITFHVIDNPQVERKLREELRIAVPDKEMVPSLGDLEQLPYLSAVINEGLRHGTGGVHRFMRSFPDTDLQYNEWTIPAGVPVGSTTAFYFADPNIFPDPAVFQPERFLTMDKAHYNKYFFPFQKGARSCVGMNLAYAQLYLMLAATFRPGGPRYELYKTDYSDIKIEHDFFSPSARLDSKGVRVTIKEDVDKY